MIRAAARIAGLALLAAIRLPAAQVPAIFLSAPGHFEVASLDAAAAQSVAARAEDGWRTLTTPLGLPERFSTPVFVRLVPAADWNEPTPFRVIVEAGGIVSVRIRWSEATSEFFLRRALVQALLMRLAVTQHGVAEKLAAPLWLELGCVSWWETRAEPAQLDALKQESERFDPLSIAALLGWQRGEDESSRLAADATWLLTWLQVESGRPAEWPAMLRRLLGGEEGGAALAASFPGRFASDRERELWWRTGWHQLRRVHALPTLEATESRDALAGLTRFVFAPDGRDVVMPLSTMLTHAREPIVEAELRRRLVELNRLLPALHPFYRNAGLSLAAALGGRNASAASRAALAAEFERDWGEAGELETAVHAALDTLEKR